MLRVIPFIHSARRGATPGDAATRAAAPRGRRGLVTAPMRSTFHAGLAYWDQRNTVAAASAQLRRLAAAVHGASDPALFQWGQLFAATLDFAPTLIVELGRHRGNSTCVFTTAAQALDARVVSLCLSPCWRTETRPRLAGLVPPSWLSYLEAHQADIAAGDFDAIVGTRRGCGSSGTRTATTSPSMSSAGCCRPSPIARISSSRTASATRATSCRPRGRRASATRCGAATTGRGRACGSGISTAASSRRSRWSIRSWNRVVLHTAAEDIHGAIGGHSFRVEAMERTLGDLWAAQAHWCHFSLNGRPGSYRFPAAARAQVPAPAGEGPA